MTISATSSTARPVPYGQVVETQTASRVTPNQGPTFREVLSGGAKSLLNGAEVAVRSLPMGQVLAASVRPGGYSAASSTSLTPGTAGLQAQASTGTASSQATSTGSAQGDPSVEAALAQSQDMNLYFIQLQERMAAENRAFTTYSNVLKARHDTVKNAIGNIR
jgi:hypothetical protein